MTEVKTLVSRARREAEQTITSAVSDAERKRSQARAEAEQMLDTARAEVEVLNRHRNGIADQLAGLRGLISEYLPEGPDGDNEQEPTEGPQGQGLAPRPTARATTHLRQVHDRPAGCPITVTSARENPAHALPRSGRRPC